VRGKLKLQADELLVGDIVEYSKENGQGVICNVLPRRNALIRPYIANVDLILLIFAHVNPDPNPLLIAKFLVLAEASGVPYQIVFNKTDLVEKGKAKKLANIYQGYGYQVLCTSVVTHLGKMTLKKLLTQKVVVLAGPSGVGKSALLNMLAPGLSLQTGTLSLKVGRGKHTTREVQLLRLKPNSYAADSPGFTQIDIDFLKPAELAELLPDLAPYQGKCKFNVCLHSHEPDCTVKKAVEAGLINPERYRSYLELLQEVTNSWKNRYH
jgi:ribosome biogenesis GTPase